MEENTPARDPGGDSPRVPPPYDYEYDEAHDVPPGALRETAARHRADAPPELHLGEGGDYGYDEAHDFSARRSTKT